VRRAFLLLTVTLLLLGLTPRTAGAWSNGADGPNGYGTHDWILDRALTLLGPRAGWVCRGVALRATDDPDTVDGIDHASGTWWHVYDEWGDPWGGAPEAVQVWFSAARRHLSMGRHCRASHDLGIMAHLLGDMAQPMHTDGWLAAEDRVHSAYESSVDDRCRSAATCRYHASYDGRDPATPYARAVALARLSHPSYARLIRAFDAHGYSATVDTITRRQLRRAVNALADLITSL
jgi:hypothetical protein